MPTLQQALNSLRQRSTQASGLNFTPIGKAVSSALRQQFNSTAPFGSVRGRPVIGGTLPVGSGGAGILRTTGNAIGRAFTNVRNLAFGAPGFAARGRLALGVGTLPIAFAGAAGGSVNPTDVLRSAASTFINPVGGIAGTLFREGKQAGKTIVDFAGNFLPDEPLIPTTKNPIFGTPQLDLGFPSIGGFSGGASYTGSSFAPSISTGGGADYSTVALLALLGLGGGYALGRRRKKKRKYKKRGRR